MTDLKHHVGSRVRELRRQQGLTQEQLAEQLGKATETISNIERGHAYPGLSTLEALAAQMKAPVRYFFEGFEENAGELPHRLKAEAALRELTRRMSDQALEIAVEQGRVLAERLPR